MKELTGSAKIADDAISGAERFLERDRGTTTAWFRLAYAALRILANIADSLDRFDEAVDHGTGCIVTRSVEL